MTCLEFRSLIDRYVDQELSAEEKNLTDEHVHNCRDCHEELASHRQLKSLLSGYQPSHVPSDGYWEESRQRIAAKTILSSPGQGSNASRSAEKEGDYGQLSRSFLSLAASIALLLTALYFGSIHDRSAVVIRNNHVEFIVPADLADMITSTRDGELSLGEQRRIGLVSVLVGGPGMLGRFDYLPGLLRVY